MPLTITQPSSDFTARDFDSWLAELRSKATSTFPAWTDFNTANFGNFLLEMFAHTLDVGSYTQDQQFKETRSQLARLRRSMISLGKLVTFTLPGATVATVDLEISFADGLARVQDLVIPSGTVVRTEDGTVEYDLTEETTILAGDVQIEDVPAENARAQSENFVATGLPGFSFVLGQVPYVDDSGVVTIGVDSFTEAESFFESGPTDKHYVVTVDDEDRASFTFGDGTNGVVATGAGTVAYKTGGGFNGRVDANTLVAFRDGNRFPTLSGEQSTLTVRNPSGSSGGVDRMEVEEARVAMPAHVRTLGRRSVTQQDFEDNALKVRGVARAMMLTSDNDPDIEENRGELYIVPVGGGLPSSTLKTEVLDFINDEYPPTLTFDFTVEDPSLRIVSVAATVSLNRGVTESDARAAVEESLDLLFSLSNEDGSPNEAIDFGFRIRNLLMEDTAVQGEVAWSDIFNAVRDAATATGARVFRKVEEDDFSPADDVPLTDTQFPVLGSITLINAETGDPF